MSIEDRRGIILLKYLFQFNQINWFRDLALAIYYGYNTYNGGTGRQEDFLERIGKPES